MSGHGSPSVPLPGHGATAAIRVTPVRPSHIDSRSAQSVPSGTTHMNHTFYFRCPA